MQFCFDDNDFRQYLSTFMKSKIITTLSVATLALTFSACGDSSKYVTVNNGAANSANKSNTAVANTTPANTASTTNAAAPAVDGDVLKIDEAGIMMTVPKGMKYSKDGEDTIVKTEDEGVDTRFTVPKGDDYNKAIDAAVAEIDEYISDVKVEEKGKKSTQNGMDVTSMSGTGKASNGEQVQWQLAILDAPKKPVIALTYAEAASLEKHQADLGKFFASIKKQ